MDVRICERLTRRQNAKLHSGMTVSHWWTLHNPRWPVTQPMTHTGYIGAINKGSHEQRTSIGRFSNGQMRIDVELWFPKGGIDIHWFNLSERH